MADKYNQVKPKVHPITIASIAIFLVIVFAVILFVGPSESKILYSEYELSGLQIPEEFTEDHPFVEIRYKSGFLGFNRGLAKTIEKEEYVLLYIGSAGCEVCASHIGAFQKYFYQEGVDQYIDPFYYFDPSDQIDELTELVTNYPEITQSTPQLILFKDGVVVATFTPTGTDAQSINRTVKEFYADEVLPVLNQ